MEIWSVDKLVLFVAFFVPGFIALQIYSLLVSIDDSDLPKRLPAVVAYSAVHYAITGWIILVAPENLRIAAAYLVVLILPIFWPPVVLLIRDPKRWGPIICSRELFESILSPEASPWDRVFTNKARFVRVKLKTGGFAGGFLGVGSVVSAYPCPEQLYISNAFTLDQKTGEFGEELANTGILVNGAEISIIELIEAQK